MDQYNKVYGEKRALEDKFRCLEEAHRLLKEKLRGDENLDEEDHGVRRRDDEQAGGESRGRAEAGTSRKRLAPVQELDNIIGHGENCLLPSLENDAHLRLSSYGNH